MYKIYQVQTDSALEVWFSIFKVGERGNSNCNCKVIILL